MQCLQSGSIEGIHSEGSFSNNFTNMMTKGVITYNQKFVYDELSVFFPESMKIFFFIC